MSIGGGVEQKGKTKGKNLGNDGASVGIQTGSMNKKKTGGKTPEMILPIGKSRARLKVQTGD